MEKDDIACVGERPEYNLIATGKNMRRLRKERKLSVEDVRKYMKLGSVQAIYKWELGQCFPAADNLLALAELYQVNPTQLLIRECSHRYFGKDGFVRLCLKGADYVIFV